MTKEYIEREEALSNIDKAFKMFQDHNNILRLYSDVRLVVIEEPAADVAPVRRGRWINNNIYDAAFFICDQCCAMCDNKTNYCPNCGAKMREEQSVDKEEKHEM